MENDGVILGQRDSDFLAGVLPYEERNPSGDWTQFLPEGEKQFRYNISTQACVSFSALNCLEVQSRFFGVGMNLSDRFTAFMSGTTPNGNWLWKVADSVRKDGVVSEEDWPFPFLSVEDYIGKSEEWVWNFYYTPPPIEIINKAKKFLESWSVAYEWIDATKESLMHHLKHAPVQVVLPGHAVMNFFTNEQVIKYLDSYEPYLKETQSILSAMKIVLSKKQTMLTQEQVNLFYDIEALPKDDSGRTYWIGKPVEEMLKTRKADLKSFLNS